MTIYHADSQAIIPDGTRRIADAYQSSPAVSVPGAGLIFVSGQVGGDEAGQPIADPEAQFVAAIKSLRERSASLEDAYAKIEGGEVWLLGSDIPEYTMGNRMNHKPKRPRKLLLHRREIDKFAGKASQRGFTLVPLRLYFKDGRAKVELAVCRGKAQHDKRQAQKKADAQREIRRAMSERRK